MSLHLAKLNPGAHGGIGLDAVTIDELLKPHQQLIQRLKVASGETPEDFARLHLPVIRLLAAMTHLLPASRGAYYGHPGGLLHKNLVTALIALMASDAHIFTLGETTEKRRILESRWRYAAFLGGIFAGIGWVCTGLRVIDRLGAEWNPMLQTLAEWLQKRGEKYYLYLSPQEEEGRDAITAMLLQRYLPVASLDFLMVDGQKVLTTLLGSIVGRRPQSLSETMWQIVDKAQKSAISKDHKLTTPGSGQVGGIPLDVYLVDAIRALARQRWTTNHEHSSIFVTDQGVFLAWPQTAQDVHDYLAYMQIPGVPSNPDTTADVLIRHGFVSPNAATHSPIWRITVQVEEKEIQHDALRLNFPDTLYPEGVLPPSIPASVEGQLPPPAMEDSQLEGQGGNQDVRATFAEGNRAHAGTSSEGGKQQIALNLTDRQEAVGGTAKENVPAQKKTDDPVLKVLMRVSKLLAADPRLLQEHLFMCPEGIALRYPEAITGHVKDEAAFADALARRDWLQIDPTRPLSRVRKLEVAGRGVVTALLLTEEPSDILRGMLGDAVAPEGIDEEEATQS